MPVSVVGGGVALGARAPPLWIIVHRLSSYIAHRIVSSSLSQRRFDTVKRSQLANHVCPYYVCMRILISLLYPSYPAMKVSLSCFSSYLILFWDLYPFMTLDSKESCYSENDGVEKPPITVTWRSYRSGPVTRISQENPTLGSKYKNACYEGDYCFDPIEPPLLLTHSKPPASTY